MFKKKLSSNISAQCWPVKLLREKGFPKLNMDQYATIFMLHDPNVITVEMKSVTSIAMMKAAFIFVTFK